MSYLYICFLVEIYSLNLHIFCTVKFALQFKAYVGAVYPWLRHRHPPSPLRGANVHRPQHELQRGWLPGFRLFHPTTRIIWIWTFLVVMMKPAMFCVDKILLMLHGSLSVQMDAPNQNFQKIFAASIIWSMGFKICASLTKVRPTFKEQAI